LSEGISLLGKAHPEERPVQPRFFIVGVQRSGTTLLRTLLDRHTLISIPLESHFIPWLFARRGRYGREMRIERPDRFLDDLYGHGRFKGWGIPRERLYEALSAIPDLRLSEAISVVYAEFAGARGKTIAGDKTPRYGEHIAVLNRLFPTSVFIHMIRDGRDVALSMMEINPGHQHTSASAAFFWRRRLDMVSHASRVLAADRRYHEVRYESLIADPDRELRRLCDFLGVGFQDAMLQHDDRLLRELPAARRSLHKNLALPLTKGLRDFSVQMEPAAIEEFEAVGGRHLLKYGYRLSGPHPGLAVRIRSWWHVARFAQRNYLRLRLRRRRRKPGRTASVA
jgi:hypothetical protein